MIFRFTTAGESHGKALMAVIEGLPAGLKIDQDFINLQLWRRQQGYGRGHRMKIESDKVEIVSGIRHGFTLGSPIALMIENKDFTNWQEVMSVQEVDNLDEKRARRLKRPRPGHADLAGGQKFQTHDLRDILERSSARETAARVAVGAFAKLLLKVFDIEIISHVIMLGGIPDSPILASWEEILKIQEDTELRCVDKEASQKMLEHIDKTKESGDTLGGIFEVVAKNIPIGLGSHTQWDLRLDGLLAQSIMAIQAVKAVEIGEGMEGARLAGSKFHDEIGYNKEKKHFTRLTNHAGGVEGGISNGEEIRVRGYLKPISTLRKPLQSVDVDTKEISVAAFERSDITAVAAAGVIGEAAVATVLADLMRKKFGGDSLKEMKANFLNYKKDLINY
ncbi:MAG: chorismate synthase [Acidobacteria bacterium]|nr:chorismate synthase [Acidobacteriota bacterium]